MRIGNRELNSGKRPCIVAELSGNHKGSLLRAKELVAMAAEAGVDAIKVQTLTADTMTVKSSAKPYQVNETSSPWYGRSLYDLYNESAMPWEWQEELFNLARDLGIDAFGSAFDKAAVDFLISINSCCIKIASPEITDHMLLESCATSGLPVVISTGMATMEEVTNALRILNEAGARDVIALKCTTSYPAALSSCNLQAITTMREQLGVEVGLSDHTLGYVAAQVATALGAVMIEKHITLSKEDGAIDSSFSMEPNEFALFVKNINAAWSSLGNKELLVTEKEMANRKYRRSLYLCRSVKRGDKVTKDSVVALRPVIGIEAQNWPSIEGKKYTCDGNRFDPIFEAMVAMD